MYYGEISEKLRDLIYFDAHFHIFWSKSLEIKLHLINTFCFNFLKKLTTHHFLKMIIFRRELMKLIIYVDSVLYMRSTGKLCKLHNLYTLKSVPTKF